MKRKIIAVTGGMGSGKSTLLGMLKAKGFATLDCDKLAKQVAESPQLVAEVVRLLGDEACKNGKLNRKYIRERVFSDKTLYDGYTSLFYGRVKQELERALEGVRLAFVEIQVLDAFPFPWFAVWRVESDSQLRIDRVMRRDGVNEDNVRSIMAVQKDAAATLTFTNNGDIKSLSEQLERALSSLT